MAFTSTGQTYIQRKTYLDRVQSYLNQLVAINEAARKIELDMLDASESAADVVSTVDLILPAAGPPSQSADTDVADCTGETITDRMINILSSTAGLTWAQATPT